MPIQDLLQRAKPKSSSSAPAAPAPIKKSVQKTAGGISGLLARSKPKMAAPKSSQVFFPGSPLGTGVADRLKTAKPPVQQEEAGRLAKTVAGAKKLIGGAIDMLSDTTFMPSAPITAPGSFVQGAVGQRPVSRIPYAGDAYDIKNMTRLLSISRKMKAGEAVSEEDRTFADTYIRAEEEHQRRYKEDFGYAAGSVVGGSATFMLELLGASALAPFTGGGSLGAVLASKGTVKGTKEIIKKAVEDKAFRTILAQETGKMAKTFGIQTALTGTTNIPRDTVERMVGTPLVTDQGDFGGLLDDGQALPEALLNAATSHLVEIGSERTGGAFTLLGDAIKTPIVKAGIIKAVTKKNPTLSPNIVRRIVERAGWHGVLQEFGEERVADVANGVFNELGMGDIPFEVPTVRDMAVELAAFSVMGSAVNTIEKTVQRVSSGKTPERDDEIEEHASAAVEEARAMMSAGASPAEVALNLTKEMSVTAAETIVKEAVVREAATHGTTKETPQSETKKEQKATPEKTASEIDQEFADMLDAHGEETADLRRQVTELEQRVKEAEPRTNEKKEAKLALEEVRKELRALEKRQGEQIEEATSAIRADLEKIVEGMGTGLPVGEIVDAVLERSAEPDAADITLRQLIEEVTKTQKEGAPAKKNSAWEVVQKLPEGARKGETYQGEGEMYYVPDTHDYYHVQDGVVRKLPPLEEKTKQEKQNKKGSTKPQKKDKKAAVKSNIQKREYQTIHEGGVVKMVEGEPVNIVEGVETFIHAGDGGWIVSDATTGRFLADSRTKEGAIAKAKLNIDNVGIKKFKEMLIANQLKETKKAKPASNKEKVNQLEQQLRDAYASAGESEVEGFTKADEILSDIATEMELSRPGERIFLEHDGTRDSNVIGVPSTFPKWVSEGNKSSKLFNAVLGTLEISKLHFPEGNRTRQRAFYNEILDQLDVRLGLDTSVIRGKIIELYDSKTSDKKETAKDAQRGADRGAEAAKGEQKADKGKALEGVNPDQATKLSFNESYVKGTYGEENYDSETGVRKTGSRIQEQGVSAGRVSASSDDRADQAQQGNGRISQRQGKGDRVAKNADVGEKIGGARKDVWKKSQDLYRLSISDKEALDLPLSKVLPKLDYKALHEAGMKRDTLTRVAWAVSAIPKKPVRPSARRRWAQQVIELRGLIKALLENPDIDALFNEGLEFSPSLKRSYELTAQVYEALDFIENPEITNYQLDAQTWRKTTGDVEFEVVSLIRKGAVVERFRPKEGETTVNAVEAVRGYLDKQRGKEQAEKKEVDVRKYISIFTNRMTGRVFTAYKKGETLFEFETFDTIDEARAVFKSPEKIAEYIKKLEEAVMFDKNTFRTGDWSVGTREYRSGDVSAEEFMQTFGFRGVEFGNWVNNQERQDRLNRAYDSFKDLAAILGVPDKAISLNGELGFAFGARGTKGAAAHYEAEKVVINITKLGGAGTLAHEWWHAFDNYLSRRDSLALSFASERGYSRAELNTKFLALTDYIRKSDLGARSQRADKWKGKPYFSKTREMTARAFEVFVKEALRRDGKKNAFLVSVKDATDVGAEHDSVYPYARGEEVAEVYRLCKDIVDAVQLDTDGGRAAMYKKTEEGDAQQETVGRDEAVAYLADVKQRLNLSFDAYFFDTILAGYKFNPFTKQKTGIEAWGATLDNTVALLKTMEQYTPHHEVGHLVLGNLDKIPTFSKRGITRAKLMRAQAEKMGIEWSKATDGQIEEAMMRDFEKYLQHKHAPKGILRTFFIWLKEQLVRVARAINLTKGDIVQDYYDILDEGKAVDDTMVRLENTGVIEAFQDESILDMDLAESALTRFKLKHDGDSRYQKLQQKYNELAERHAKLEADAETWRKNIASALPVKKEAEQAKKSASEEVKAAARFVHRTKPPVGELTEAGQENIKTNFADSERAEAEVRDYLKNKAQLEQSRKMLADTRRKIADSKGTIKTNKQVLRDIERRLKMRKRLLERQQYYIEMGLKRGFKRGAVEGRKQVREDVREKRVRDEKLDKIKKIYQRVVKATRTGKYLPLDYQKRLIDLFEGFDLTSMTEKTRKELEASVAYFANQNKEVPSTLAKDLLRLSKVPIGKMTDEELNAFVETVTRIYEQGVLKKKLLRYRDETTLKENVAKLVASTHPFDTDVKGKAKDSFINRMRRNVNAVSAKIYDPARFASYVDGALNYSGEHFKQIVEPTRQAINEAEVETSAILKESFEKLKEIADSFTDDEQARIMYYSAIEQGGDEQAQALAQQYPDIDFKAPLTEKERSALQVMKEAFKRVRPEIAATYEAIQNKPFPDNPHYFPYRYDKDVETYEIDENAFDFDVKKTSQGFTIARENKVDRVLNINVFETFVSSLKKQIYYAKVQPELENIKALLNSHEYQKTADVLTKNYWAQFVTDVATQGRGQGSFPVLDWMRGNVSAALLGYKLSTVLIQISGAFDGMMNVKEQLGWGAAAKVFPELVTLAINKAKLDRTVEGSVELQNRQGGQIEIAELQHMYRGMFSPNWYVRAWSTYKEHAYIGIRLADMRVASAVYNTLRDGYLAQGMSEDEATAMAEQIMILSQSSHNVANRPQMLNNSATKFLFPFSSFIFNSFNNARYDGVRREIQKHGLAKGMFTASTNLSFIGMAITYEMVMYMVISALLGYDDDDRSLVKQFFAQAAGRIPGAGYFIAFDGSFEGLRLNNPAIEAVDKVFENISNLSDGATRRELYNTVKNALVFLGFPGTQQLHQILTAPDVAGMGSIGLSTGITYDARSSADKRVDTLKPIIERGETITKDQIDVLATKVYGSDFENSDAQYKEDKRTELVREIAIRQKYGYDDPLINVLLDKKSNNDVKAVFARLDDPKATLGRYKRTLPLFGKKYDVFSDQLYKELRYIAAAPEKDRERIAKLAEAKDDAERDSVVGNDKAFAKRAFQMYKLVSKAYYESI